MSRRPARGVSRSVKSTSGQGTGAGPSTRTVGITTIRKEAAAGQEKLTQELSGLGQKTLDAINDIQGSSGLDTDMGAGTDMGADPSDVVPDDGDAAWEPAAPDLDGDAFAFAARDVMDHRFRGRIYRDHRTWRQRIQHMNVNWQEHLEEMTDAYLHWKYPPDATNDMATDSPEVSEHPITPEEMDTSYDFTIDILNIYTLEKSAKICREATSKSVAEALCLNGYIGNSPEKPTLAVSMCTLELFHRIRLRKASFSIEAFAKVLCDLYNVPYRRRIRNAFSNAFDVYLTLMRRVETEVKKVLGHDGANWRVLNSCPACCYELNDEPPLKFSRMFAMDANFSLKRMAFGNRTAGDTREFLESDYYLRDEEIERYANEVKRQARAPPVPDSISGPSEPSDDSDEVNGNDDQGDPTDGIPDMSAPGAGCAVRWKAASADEKKKMWAVFQESGFFLSACRHGIVLWMADLIRSGELAKFPLAVIAKALEVLGIRWLVGYDIGCAFSKTIANSSLGKAFAEALCRCCVNAFHGYSHSYDCQKQHHPNVIEGMGLEDLEVLERIFSASNALGGITRYMTRYRRRVFIDLFFKQWDAEKYANLGTMLHNNYVQALKILEEEEPALEHAKEIMGITQQDLDSWHREEVVYFSTLGQEPEYDVLRVAYVELLQKYRDVCAKYDDAASGFLLSTPSDSAEETYESRLSDTRKRETQRRYLGEKRDQALLELVEMEAKLQIQQRWTPLNPKYVDALRYATTRDYHRALDRLQRLVIQRLFELHKLNLNFTGYRMRSHIAKALQARCKAIRNAVNTYNEVAKRMSPPRKTLDWSQVSHYSFLEEFDLLRGTRQDIQDKPWATAVARVALKQDLRIKRAREEIIRCNVEIVRVHAAILDEHDFFEKCRLQFAKDPHPIHGAVLEHMQLRQRVNYTILFKLQQTHQLKGFTGNGMRGVRKGATPSSSTSDVPSAFAAPPSENFPDDEEEGQEADGGEEDDEQAAEVIALVDYISDLPRQNI